MPFGFSQTAAPRKVPARQSCSERCLTLRRPERRNGQPVLQCFDSLFQFINTESPPLYRTPPQKSESSYYNGQDRQHQISHETPKSLKGFSRASRARDTSLRSVVPDLLRDMVISSPFG